MPRTPKRGRRAQQAASRQQPDQSRTGPAPSCPARRITGPEGQQRPQHRQQRRRRAPPSIRRRKRQPGPRHRRRANSEPGKSGSRILEGPACSAAGVRQHRRTAPDRASSTDVALHARHLRPPPREAMALPDLAVLQEDREPRPAQRQAEGAGSRDRSPCTRTRAPSDHARNARVQPPQPRRRSRQQRVVAAAQRLQPARRRRDRRWTAHASRRAHTPRARRKQQRQRQPAARQRLHVHHVVPAIGAEREAEARQERRPPRRAADPAPAATPRAPPPRNVSSKTRL